MVCDGNSKRRDMRKTKHIERYRFHSYSFCLKHDFLHYETDNNQLLYFRKCNQFEFS